MSLMTRPRPVDAAESSREGRRRADMPATLPAASPPATLRIAIASDDVRWSAAAARALSLRGVDAAVVGLDIRPDDRRLADRGLVLLKPLEVCGACWAACLRLGGRPDRCLILVHDVAEPSEAVLALELGADDCLPASMAADELVARLHARARRMAGAPSSGTATIPVYHFDGWRFAPAAGELRTPQGRRLDLTTNDLQLLATLLSRPGQVFTRRELSDLLDRGEGGPVDWRIRVHRLRARLQRSGSDAAWLRTVHGRGYALDAPVVRLEEPVATRPAGDRPR